MPRTLALRALLTAAGLAAVAPAAPAGQGCTADTNGDNLVNFFDLNTVLSQFGQSGAGLAGDINNDNIVNFFDLNILLAQYGQTCGALTVSSVTPAVASPGSMVTINGSGFEGDKDDYCIIIVGMNTDGNPVSASLRAMAANGETLVARLNDVPPGLSSGIIKIARGDGQVTNNIALSPGFVLDEPFWGWRDNGGPTVMSAQPISINQTADFACAFDNYTVPGPLPGPIVLEPNLAFPVVLPGATAVIDGHGDVLIPIGPPPGVTAFHIDYFARLRLVAPKMPGDVAAEICTVFVTGFATLTPPIIATCIPIPVTAIFPGPGIYRFTLQPILPAGNQFMPGSFGAANICTP